MSYGYKVTGAPPPDPRLAELESKIVRLRTRVYELQGQVRRSGANVVALQKAAGALQDALEAASATDAGDSILDCPQGHGQLREYKTRVYRHWCPKCNYVYIEQDEPGHDDEQPRSRENGADQARSVVVSRPGSDVD